MERQHTTNLWKPLKNVPIAYFQGHHHKKLQTLSPPSAARSVLNITVHTQKKRRIICVALRAHLPCLGGYFNLATPLLIQLRDPPRVMSRYGYYKFQLLLILTPTLSAEIKRLAAQESGCKLLLHMQPKISLPNHNWYQIIIVSEVSCDRNVPDMLYVACNTNDWKTHLYRNGIVCYSMNRFI